MRKLTAFLVASAVATVALPVAACSPQPGSQPCFPPPLSLSTATAAPGDSVMVSAKDATCNPRYGPHAQIKVEVFDSAGTMVVERTGPMNDAGGFSFNFELPVAAVPGTWMVSAFPHDVDWCDDTGRNNRVGRGPGGEDMQRVSCVLPSLELLVAP
ncbi:hypothetical protein [Arthrobacter sp. E3]|uniref:hypothetical protein n=1 Tax=Arthrobacter sp. E3 TaxID=517402 RepID=UPI001A94F73F|nr:hypothetical protein [Arthrobacter sp. E3]